MRIENYISALLYRYQCVTVPGFGAFLTEIQSAQYIFDTNTFYPPKKLVSFNANLKNNDGLLANHIALHEKISYENAAGLISQEVKLWEQQLQTEGKIILKNIGEIILNIENSLVFYPDSPVNYFTESFGLSAVVSQAIKRGNPVPAFEADNPSEEIPVVQLTSRKRVPYFKYAAVFVTALTLGSAAFKMYYDNEIERQTLLVEKSVQDQINQKIQQATFFIENPLPSVTLTVKENTDKMLYHIVAGAFRNEKNAEKACRQLIEKGYKAKKINKNKFGLYPVIYQSYTTHDEAQAVMSHIHRTENREAWLLITEL